MCRMGYESWPRSVGIVSNLPSMRVLAFDISTKTGWALLEGEMGKNPTLVDRGCVKLKGTVKECGVYPWNYVKAAQEIADELKALVDAHKPDGIVIEETNKSRARYSQKALEFIHCAFLELMYDKTYPPTVAYISSSEWRKTLGQGLTSDQKNANKRLSKAKSAAKRNGEAINKKELGIVGKVTKKHVSVQWVNENFGLSLKMCENDVADAICEGASYFLGAKICDGT